MNLGFAVSLSGCDLEQMARQCSRSLDQLTEGETRCPQLRVFLRIKRGRLGSAQPQMTLAKYSLYSYHLNQPLAAGLEKPLLPHTGSPHRAGSCAWKEQLHRKLLIFGLRHESKLIFPGFRVARRLRELAE